MPFTIPTIFTAVNRLSGPMQKMAKDSETFANKLNNAGKGAIRLSRNAAIAGAAIFAPLALSAKAAIEFEERMADISKTTGITGPNLQKLGKQILAMSKDTRTSIGDLQKIALIGGQLGIAEKDMEGFLKAGNKFAVALGDEYEGGVETAITQVSKLKSLFKDTRGLDISAAIEKSGSAINALGADGAATSQNINDFALRVGALPDNIKPSIDATLALGAFFENVGINADIASGGFTNFLLKASQHLPDFARQLKMTTAQARNLLTTDPTEFAKKFAKTLDGATPDKLATTLHDLHINTQESIKVVGALTNSMSLLNRAQEVSAKAFAEGTSLTGEYNIKMATTKAQFEKAANSVQALAIIIGQELLPHITKMLTEITPLIEAVVKWVQENPILVETLLKLAAAAGTLAFAISGISLVIGLYQKAVVIATGAQAAFNAVVAINPFVAIAVVIALLIGLVYQAVKHFHSWGAAVLWFLGPIGWVIGALKIFYDNWDRIVKAFTTGGIIAGIKQIGATILDFILAPVEQVLKALSYIPGIGGKIEEAMNSLHAFRRDVLGVETAEPEVPYPMRINYDNVPKSAENDKILKKLDELFTKGMTINIEGDTKGVTATGVPGITPKLSKTM